MVWIKPEQLVDQGAKQLALPASLLLKPPSRRAHGFVRVSTTQRDDHVEQLVDGDQEMKDALPHGHSKTGNSGSTSAYPLDIGRVPA